jgi:hypothetical protein
MIQTIKIETTQNHIIKIMSKAISPKITEKVYKKNYKNYSNNKKTLSLPHQKRIEINLFHLLICNIKRMVINFNNN